MQRIKDIEGYKGNTDGYMRLYAAIWQKAVEDELRHQMARLLIDTSESLLRDNILDTFSGRRCG